MLHDCIQSLLRIDFSPSPTVGSQEDGITVLGNHELRHLAAEGCTSSFYNLVRRQHLAPSYRQSPQLVWHEAFTQSYYNWKHFAKPVSVS